MCVCVCVCVCVWLKGLLFLKEKRLVKPLFFKMMSSIFITIYKVEAQKNFVQLEFERCRYCEPVISPLYSHQKQEVICLSALTPSSCFSSKYLHCFRFQQKYFAVSSPTSCSQRNSTFRRKPILL